MSKDFYTAIKDRRSVYSISKGTTVSDERITEVVEHAVKYTPSSFNAQSSRVIILLGENHDELWNITEAALKKIVPEDQFGPTKEKINAFRNGYGTILFFEDEATIEALQTQFSLYKDNFPVWSQQSSGMLQFAVWTSLANEGLGATLQHYNELIEEAVKDKWAVAKSWKLIAQMPFGKIVNQPDEKEFSDIEDRVRILK